MKGHQLLANFHPILETKSSAIPGPSFIGPVYILTYYYYKAKSAFTINNIVTIIIMMRSHYINAETSIL